MAERQRSASDVDDDDDVQDMDIEGIEGTEEGSGGARRRADGDDRPPRRRADRTKRRRDDGRRDDDGGAAGGGAAREGRRLSAAQAGREGLRQVMELTGKDPETVTGVEPAQDGWLVTVEVVEDRRIPSSTDILSTYEAEIDNDGELLSYRRVRRYSRGAGSDGDD